MSPTIILPIGILVPIIASKIWNNYPLKQFMHAYKVRVTLVPIVDILMLLALRRGKPSSISGRGIFWGLIILSTALQSIVNSLQFNAQMTFFAKRVDPAIGGSYMTLLNTAANLGGTWPAPVVMWLIGSLSSEPHCYTSSTNGEEICEPSRDPFFLLQTILSLLGCLWIFFLGKKVQTISDLPDDAWRTREKRNSDEFTSVDLSAVDVELGDAVKYQPSQLKGDKLS